MPKYVEIKNIFRVFESFNLFCITGPIQIRHLHTCIIYQYRISHCDATFYTILFHSNVTGQQKITSFAQQSRHYFLAENYGTLVENVIFRLGTSAQFSLFAQSPTGCHKGDFDSLITVQTRYKHDKTIEKWPS